MKLFTAILLILALVGISGCTSPSAPTTTTDGKNAQTPTKQEPSLPHFSWKLFPFAPFIADGKPSILTPTQTFDSKVIYGTVHGAAIGSIVFEQLFLAKADYKLDNGVQLLQFPNFLPLAVASGGTKKLYWAFQRTTDGMTAADSVTAPQFFNDTVAELKENGVLKVRYVAAMAVTGSGYPPSPQNGGMTSTTTGYSETMKLSVHSSCQWSIFALDPIQSDMDLLQQSNLPTINRVRRIIQVCTKACGTTDDTVLQQDYAEVQGLTNTDYGKWLESIDGWSDVLRFDGIIAIDDDFVPTEYSSGETSQRALQLLFRSAGARPQTSR